MDTIQTFRPVTINRNNRNKNNQQFNRNKNTTQQLNKLVINLITNLGDGGEGADGADDAGQLVPDDVRQPLVPQVGSHLASTLLVMRRIAVPQGGNQGVLLQSPKGGA